MIALSIAFAWLALALAAFLTLSALGRVAARRDFEAQLGLLGSEPPVGLSFPRHVELARSSSLT